MDEYLAHIGRLDLEDSTELINNSSTEHAIPLVAKLFARGREQLRIFTGSLNPKIYAERSVIDALGVFLIGRSGKVSILVQDAEEKVPDSAIVKNADGLIERLKDQFGPEIAKQISIKRASPETREQITNHFLVVDGKGFRFEPDNKKHEAVASFNRPDIAQALNETFEKMFAQGKMIEVA